MNNFFMALFLLSLAGLIAGLANPQLLKMRSRKMASIVFGGSAVVFFILFGVTMPPTPQLAVTSAAPAATSSEVANTSNASTTLDTGAHGATQAKTTASPMQSAAAPSPQPATLAPQQPTAPAPSQPATLTDSAYLQQFDGTVMLYIQALGSDVLNGNAAIADSNVAQTSAKQSSDISAALTDFQQGQSDLAQVQTALQALQGKTPPDMANIQSLTGEYLTSEAQVLSLFIGHINSNTLSMSDTLDVYAQINRSNLYQGQMNTAIQQWESANY